MSFRRCRTIFLLLPLAVAPLLAETPNKPVVAAIEPFLEQNEISGAVTLVAKKGKILSFDAVGLADIADGKPMKKDTLFWIASMTKPMAGAAILMLQDAGKLHINDPVENYLPEFRGLWLVTKKSADAMVLKRPARPITLKDLLTHTSGLPNVDAPRPHSTLAELVSIISQQPLQFEPGSKWSYSNAGIDTVGRVAEVVSGQLFDEFLKARIFKPLGMRSTSFHPSRSLSKRLARSYEKNEQTGTIDETDVFFVKGDLWDEERTVRPAGGLFSTAEDLFRFYQMMLNGGEWRGKRLLSHDAVTELTRTQTGDIKTGFTDGMSWGLGFQVVKDPQGVTGMLSPGTFGHGGAYATQSWADPKLNSVYILMIQRRGFPNGDNSDVRKAFQAVAVKLLPND
jgi:CubicO group peptidase (beta-lactamase class C family)